MKKSLRDIRRAMEGKYLSDDEADNDNSLSIEEAGSFTLTIDQVN